jgi:hypothetical protein
MKRRAVVAAVLPDVVASGRSAEPRGPSGSNNAGNWKGGACNNDQTGEFWHCAAGSIYQGGISFAAMSGAAASSLIEVVFPKYRICVGWS